MPDTSDQIRVSVRLRHNVDSDLFDDLSAVGPYFRPRRLLYLAKMGLAAEKGRFRLGGEALLAAAPNASQLAATPPAALDPPPAPPVTTDELSISYEPDLSALWETGLMG